MRPITGWILAAALLPSTLAAAVAPVDEPSGGRIPPDGEIPYVVITERRLQGPFMRLVEARNHSGLRAAVVTIEQIEADHPAGGDLAERIRMFLQDAHANRGTQWVLLGGDASVVPMRRARLWSALIPPFDLPTDQYYACLDGTWNADGDGYWGEGPGPGGPGDAPDLFPELYVGRAPVRTASEVVDFVQRTLDYENGLASMSPRSALLAADVIGDLVDGALSTTEPLRPLLEADPGRAILRLYENAAAWPGSQQETRATLLAALDDGPDLAVIVGSGAPGIVVAGQEPADYVISDDLLALANATRRPIVYVLSACTTSPDGPLSIGAAFMRARRGGAAAVLGSTDNQFVGIGSQFTQRFFEEALAPDMPIGPALARAITATHMSAASDAFRLTTQGYVIFGDPALRIDPADAAAALADLRRTGTVWRALPAGAAGAALADAATTPFRTARVEAIPGATLAVVGLAASRESGAPARAAAGATPAADAAPVRASLDVLAAAGARTQATVRFELPHDALGARYELAVFDLLGRRVRALAEAPAGTMRREVAWDLRSDAGAAVPGGVYFVRLRFGERALTRRIAVLN